MSSSSLRIPAEMLKSWMDVLAPRTDLRGAAAIAKEMEAHLAKVGPDGHAVIARHQLFTWGEAVAGLARRTPMASPVQAVADDIRAVLGGRDAASTPRPGAAPGFSAPASAPAPVQPPPYSPPPASPGYGAGYNPGYGAGYGAGAAPPAATYLRGASATTPGASSSGSGGGGGIRLVPENETHLAVGNLLREARRELLIVSPWVLGLETLVNDLVRTPPGVTLRIISRRPDKEDENYHRALRDLQKRGADLVMSPYLHTRMLIGDGEALLLGAAGLPKPGVNVAREAAVLTSDPATVAAARAHFDRIFIEAKGGPPR